MGQSSVSVLIYDELSFQFFPYVYYYTFVYHKSDRLFLLQTHKDHHDLYIQRKNPKETIRKEKLRIGLAGQRTTPWHNYEAVSTGGAKGICALYIEISAYPPQFCFL